MIRKILGASLAACAMLIGLPLSAVASGSSYVAGGNWSTNVAPTAVTPNAAQNTETGHCYTLPGETCRIDFFMDKGIGNGIVNFSNGYSGIHHYTCNSGTCDFYLEGVPANDTISAVSYSIEGPGIHVYSVTP